MQLFFTTNTEKEIILSAEESKHTTKVLRKKEGDILHFTDGRGGFYNAEITIADSRKCRLTIISSEQKPKQHNYHLHIAIAPTKNIDRFEWFLEKATGDNQFYDMVRPTSPTRSPTWNISRWGGG